MEKESIWSRRVRALTHGLIISASLNAAFLATFIYFSLRQTPTFHSANYATRGSSKPMLSPSTAEVIWEYFNYSYERLLGELKDKTPIENGYSRRDLALSCLVSFHHFDIERALIGHRAQRREINFVHSEGGESLEIPLFPGLSDTDYRSILTFVKNHAWPLTSEGLFLEVKGGNSSKSLYEAFVLSSPFQVISTLLGRGEDPLPEVNIVQMISSAPWEMISDFLDDPTNLIDFNKSKKLSLLKSFALGGSSEATKLLLVEDPDFVRVKLCDEDLLRLLPLFPASPRAVEILKALLYSLRPDQVRRTAAERLYDLHGESPPDPYVHEVAVNRFITPRVQTLASRKHVVKPGESLWVIARKYQVEVHAIESANHLSSNQVLSVGKELTIP